MEMPSEGKRAHASFHMPRSWTTSVQTQASSNNMKRKDGLHRHVHCSKQGIGHCLIGIAPLLFHSSGLHVFFSLFLSLVHYENLHVHRLGSSSVCLCARACV